jgi:hypothetical protein
MMKYALTSGFKQPLRAGKSVNNVMIIWNCVIIVAATFPKFVW